MGPMLIDLIPVDQYFAAQSSLRINALRSVVNLLRNKFGVTIGYNKRLIPYGDMHLTNTAHLAQRLINAGILISAGRGSVSPDEPPYRIWSALCNVTSQHMTAGASFTSDESALIAALAEALERYLWMMESDHFIAPVLDTEAGIKKRGMYIGPREWAGFTDLQRKKNEKRQLSNESRYLWIRAESLINGARPYIPAQIVSGKVGVRPDHGGQEQIIRHPITNGLATWTTKEGARLRGMAELVEREAYMIMWLNQLTLPRVDLRDLAECDEELARALKQCERYRLKVHAIRMLTDAPIYPICVILEDESGTAPRFIPGLKAHRSLARATEGALLEALRARRGARMYASEGSVWDMRTPVEAIGHRDRLYYWSVPENAAFLTFLIEGPLEKTSAPWDGDDETAHYRRMIDWCTREQLECVSVSLGTSKKNPTPFYVEMVAMPAIQPTYLFEAHQAFGGTRLKSIPEKFGYTPRTTPYADRPHPYS